MPRFEYDVAMTIPVDLVDLASAIDGYGWAYLLTVREDRRPHVVAVTPAWSDGTLVFGVGRRSAANAANGPEVTLCYPPIETDGYSLIVDGLASVDASSGTIVFAPSKAVLHRPAPAGFEGSPTGCASDCLPVDSNSA
jgi:hypothetical protein